jgi:hypothetical protein
LPLNGLGLLMWECVLFAMETWLPAIAWVCMSQYTITDTNWEEIQMRPVSML